MTEFSRSEIMAEERLTFETFPQEILLAIFARVEFSKENFTCLTLISRKIYDLLVSNQSVLHDIAVQQFPHALYAARSSGKRIPFTSDTRQVPLSDLLNSYQRTTEEIWAFVSKVEEVRQRMLDGKVLNNYDYLGTMGWKGNLLTGLHLFERMTTTVRGSRCNVSRTLVHNEAYFRPRQTFIHSRSSAASIAMRHSALMLIDVLVFLDERYVATGAPRHRNAPLEDRLLRMAMEQVLFQGHELHDFILNIPLSSVPRRKGWDCFSFQVKYILQNGTSAWDGGQMKRFDHLLTHNIRNFLHAWDVESPACLAMLHNLRRDNKPYDDEAARKMVESFLDGLCEGFGKQS